ncbi:unnamed protein product [Larinioides sclopetarius]|uniref:Uncharacterized protein n=1 Tax=Larinioides sclopetarius TaxID=280406 RepID=A0AAV2A2X4_9ARAC
MGLESTKMNRDVSHPMEQHLLIIKNNNPKKKFPFWAHSEVWVYPDHDSRPPTHPMGLESTKMNRDVSHPKEQHLLIIKNNNPKKKFPFWAHSEVWVYPDHDSRPPTHPMGLESTKMNRDVSHPMEQHLLIIKNNNPKKKFPFWAHSEVWVYPDHDSRLPTRFRSTRMDREEYSTGAELIEYKNQKSLKEHFSIWKVVSYL